MEDESNSLLKPKNSEPDQKLSDQLSPLARKHAAVSVVIHKSLSSVSAAPYGSLHTIRQSALILKDKLFEAIEELQLRRAINKENEDKVRQLLKDKYDLTRKKEEEALELNKMIDGLKQKLKDVEHECEDKLKYCEEEKAKHAIDEDFQEKGLKALKDEIVALQLAKYTLEKKVKEQERQIGLQANNKDNQSTRIAALEERCQSLEHQKDELLRQMDKLETDIQKAGTFQRKLMRINEHRVCALEDSRNDLEKTRSELLKVKASIIKRETEGENSVPKSSSSNTCSNEVTPADLIAKGLEEQLQRVNDENKRLNRLLAETTDIVGRLTNKVNMMSESETMLQFEIDELKAENNKLSDEIVKQKKERQSAEEHQENTITLCRNEVQELQRKIKTRDEEISALQKAKQSLEELNSEWSQQNALQSRIIMDLEEKSVKEELKEGVVEAPRKESLSHEQLVAEASEKTSCSGSEDIVQKKATRDTVMEEDSSVMLQGSCSARKDSKSQECTSNVQIETAVSSKPSTNSSDSASWKDCKTLKSSIDSTDSSLKERDQRSVAVVRPAMMCSPISANQRKETEEIKTTSCSLEGRTEECKDLNVSNSPSNTEDQQVAGVSASSTSFCMTSVETEKTELLTKQDSSNPSVNGFIGQSNNQNTTTNDLKSSHSATIQLTNTEKLSMEDLSINHLKRKLDDDTSDDNILVVRGNNSDNEKRQENSGMVPTKRIFQDRTCNFEIEL